MPEEFKLLRQRVKGLYSADSRMKSIRDYRKCYTYRSRTSSVLTESPNYTTPTSVVVFCACLKIRVLVNSGASVSLLKEYIFSLKLSNLFQLECTRKSKAASYHYWCPYFPFLFCGSKHEQISYPWPWFSFQH